jgi:AraC-like DNA-binding protein
VDGLRVVELAPPGPLRGRVRLMAGFAERGAPLRRREVPIAGLVVVLSLGPDLWVDGTWTGSFAAGLYDRPVVTGHGGEQAGLQLYLPPLAGRGLLGVPPAELFNATVALEDVLPGARELTERVALEPDWRRRAAIVADVLGAGAARVAPEVRHAHDRLVATGGAARIERLAQETGWSRRHLTARFREDVGMTPKAFARLVRFERATALLRRGAGLADVAYTCGYADQPHMNRDFRALYGAPPTAFPFVQDAAGGA